MTTNLPPTGAPRLRRSCLAVPEVRGVIERRVLVNFRCAPATVAALLPPPFRPKLVGGFAVAGICLIRLTALRPAGLPASIGLTSENAAHRIAVEWEENGIVREGVFIPRRDTDSWLNRLAGGRLFPGVHQAAAFRVWETGQRFKLEMRGADGTTFVRVLARLTDTLPRGSVFGTLAGATRFFQAGALGWSARATTGAFDGLELDCDLGHLEPLAVEHVASSFFNDARYFPPGTAEFDSAFLMRNIAHRWIGRGRMECGGGAPP